jgi:hypothetical protein
MADEGRFVALQDPRFSRPMFVGGYSPAAIFTAG